MLWSLCALFQASTEFCRDAWLPPVSPHMEAESALTEPPDGPLEPQAARERTRAPAVRAVAAVCSLRNFIGLPSILRGRRWLPGLKPHLLCETGTKLKRAFSKLFDKRSIRCKGTSDRDHGQERLS